MFIVLEGADNSGKSTHARLLAEWLLAQKYEVKLTSEPNNSRLGWSIRELIESEDEWKTPEYLTCLFTANRHQHMYAPNGIKQALDAGKIVICDRFVLSNYVYQFDCLEMAQQLNSNFPIPDLLIYLEKGKKSEEMQILANRYRDFIGNQDCTSLFKNKCCFGNIETWGIEEIQEKIRQEIERILLQKTLLKL